MAKAKKHLTKSKNKVFLGVFGGIADYFGLDETLVRVIGLLIFVFTGFFPLGVFYLLAALIMPEHNNNDNSNIVDGEFREK
ncbi:PspC domain-containing protein [Limosilactobacillus sp. STM2_1]|uniref:PspC domain-containing protein n=1 Tax=Limosilactobacillus rudii TaxID=2759755 RepID=A0A7W3UMH3_9LACO|nr:PspC domain-containing protein [Limosilactobacillus rudii]MBB1079534.1 PspC domain-containing protein [Limosilactobacillus rudii]MBB1097580.1 PspC domain-containing protein [Limosilactobacillus rudii]MCD7134689.1 PspC domain-containing protein [Limosilactobacillus rudii]